ncbi:aminoglycoside phosphotransferase family protein [Streptomyces sp. H10-C2]|uniref:phosphotransferase enzyme family protein n=1 Tax=unclassified Streptomyces TaxID=2593676 RepID=UPI0024BB7569|nr:MULTISPECIES: aminoglycoside phosphotransferase family protein [unclassified Streptomyces]MDJ0345880.1 aminoglycoside phosphotransferase family protein [Streptomyces sp. PH10-H1]MDJ0374729.1 aminoglycoside phosphotransferase family protein [Streptomyces sp. H10-C2]
MPTEIDQRRDEEFTSSVAARLVVEACRAAGLQSDGARLIRLGENALFRLAQHPVIVRIARSMDYLHSVQNEVRVAQWLLDAQLPAARVIDDLEQPLVVSGHPVTFWHLIREGTRQPTYAELGRVLHDLHSLHLPDGLHLPAYSAFGRADLRIEKAVGIPDEDREFLRERAMELRDHLSLLQFDSPRGPVHGDAHLQNLMVDQDDQVILIDFENFSLDHPEWDLMVTATEYDSLRWQTSDQYASFSAAYGRDLRQWEGFPTLRAICEFKMTTWLMQNIAESRSVAAEYARRIASLRDDEATRCWSPG